MIAKNSFLGRARDVLADAIGHFNDDDGWAMSSNVALSGLLALFPFVIFVTALAGAIGQEALAGRVADLLLAAWPKEVAQPIADQVHQVLTQAHSRPADRLGRGRDLSCLERRRGGAHGAQPRLPRGRSPLVHLPPAAERLLRRRGRGREPRARLPRRARADHLRPGRRLCPGDRRLLAPLHPGPLRRSPA